MNGEAWQGLDTTLSTGFLLCKTRGEYTTKVSYYEQLKRIFHVFGRQHTAFVSFSKISNIIGRIRMQNNLWLYIENLNFFIRDSLRQYCLTTNYLLFYAISNNEMIRNKNI